jgi:hypothetical protein
MYNPKCNVIVITSNLKQNKEEEKNKNRNTFSILLCDLLITHTHKKNDNEKTS